MFFENFNVSKDETIGITHLLSNITTREGSHKGGWARLLKCQLKNMGYNNVKILDNKDSILEYGIIIFDLGAEFSGTLNMFGGLDEKVFNRLNEIKNFKGSLYSWRNDLPSILTLSGRRGNASSCDAFKQTPETFLQEVQSILDTCKTFQHAYLTNNLLIGDSHTPSVWDPSYMIERRDGRTLKGMVEKGTIEKWVVQTFGITLGHQLRSVHVHCSSIDIRHHLGRELDPLRSTAELGQKLLESLMKISDTTLIVTHTMGIEDESRELPKTGYFKGTPFYGPWDLRNRMRDVFNAVMDEFPKIDHDTFVLKFPKYFFDETGKLKFDVMEKPGSVHLSPEHYKWDLENNRPRWTHES